MGLFDKFKKEKKENRQVATEQQLPFLVEFKTNKNGMLQVDFYDKQADFKQFYDTTRLVVDPNAINLENHQFLNGAVSWYGHDDAVYIDNEGNARGGRRDQYRGVLTQIDLNLLQTDANYCYMVMKNLLSKDRVEKYLSQGLEDSPQMPCGKYVGGVMKKEGRYTKFFDERAGIASHNSPLMIKRRKEIKEKQEAKRQNYINSKKAEIEKLKQEIDDLSI